MASRPTPVPPSETAQNIDDVVLPPRVVLDACEKPPLIDEDGMALPNLFPFTCPHCIWQVVHTQQVGGGVLPTWIVVSAII
jgi:hypothetical protein